MRRYGWRAYALPLLAVVTVLVLFGGSSPTVRAAIGVSASDPATSRHAPTGPPNAASTGQLKVDDPGANSVSTALPALQLPPGPAYTVHGAGSFAVLRGHSAVFGKGQLYRFDIQAENGVRGVDLKQFGTVVMDALSDRRSWIATGRVALQRVSSGPVNFHISLASSMTVRTLCGYSLPVETSCYDAGDSRVVLNVARWMRGAKVYASDLATYRIYAVNHEVGHALGHNHAHGCLANGLAPVMMQQTIGARTTAGQICEANPWPFPPGVRGAPGAEQPGDGPDMDFYRRNAG
ncbi:MAG: DUF3152 domain-containing protein [Jatrophihabitantaceae bacterium]